MAAGRETTRRFPKFERLERRLVDPAETTINLVLGGTGPPVLLLHGYPPTHFMRRRVAPLPAKRHTVIAASLRGCGGSSKPPSTADHTPFSRHAIAVDQRRAMTAPGFGRCRLIGRGARNGLTSGSVIV